MVCGFFLVFRCRFAPAAPEKTWRGKRIIPRRGGWGVGRLFMAVKIFYFYPQMLKNRGILGIFANFICFLYLCRKNIDIWNILKK